MAVAKEQIRQIISENNINTKIVIKFHIYFYKIETTGPKPLIFKDFRPAVFHFHSQVDKIIRFATQLYTE